MGDMFQKKVNEIFSGMPNAFSIADGILIAGFDEQGKYQNETLEKILWVCRQANIKLNKDKCLLFGCTSIPSFGKVISWQGVSLDQRKVQALTDM